MFLSIRIEAGLTKTVLAALVCMACSPFSLAQAPVPGARTGAPATPVPQLGTGTLPSLGENADMSTAGERRIGDRIAASIYRDPDYVDDPVLVDYLQGIWRPLMAAARARGELNAELEQRFAWQLFLIRDRSVNAFALPGGYFGVHLGLIATVSSADELAAVLGHEMSHVTQRHIARLMTQQSRQMPWMIAAMVLGVLAAGKSGDAASAAIVGGQAVAAQNQLNFSRDMEREADRVGFGVMTDAGFESRGVASMFDKLQQASQLNDNGSFPYLRSHPLTTQRIAEARARVQLASAAESAPSSEAKIEQGKAAVLHAMMASRARILAKPGIDSLRTMLTQAQRLPKLLPAPSVPASPSNVGDAGVLYGGAFAAAQMRDFKAAADILVTLKAFVAGVPSALDVTSLLGIEVDLLAGAVPASAASIDIGAAVSRADVLTQARALMSAGRSPAATNRLRTWVAAHPKDALAWQLLAVGQGQQNQPVRAIRAEAESRAAELDYAAALDRFKAAQLLMRTAPDGVDYVEASIIDTRAREMESLVKEQALQDKIDR